MVVVVVGDPDASFTVTTSDHEPQVSLTLPLTAPEVLSSEKK